MTDAHKRALLQVARDAIIVRFRGEPRPGAVLQPPAVGYEDSGAFVSLRRGDRLRGCVGTFKGSGSIADTIGRVAATAPSDERFSSDPVTLEEMESIEIEISLLSALKRTDDPLSLVIGADGIYITRGSDSGCFLPQVGARYGWTPEQFLRECCVHKVGVEPDAWKQPETRVYLFAAEVFSEGEYRREQHR